MGNPTIGLQHYKRKEIWANIKLSGIRFQFNLSADLVRK